MPPLLDNFFIRPLLHLLTRENEFYVLAAAQKHARLLRCTRFTSEEAPLPKETPTTLRDATQTRKPDHVLENRASPGPSMGSSPGVMFGTNTDKEDRDEYLGHWYRELAAGVEDTIRDTGAPMILCCVEYEQPLYRAANAYPHLLADAVTGAPDSFKGGELHKRAMEVLDRHSAAKAD